MKRQFPGLHLESQNGDGLLEGSFLVRVDQAFYRWHPQKPFFALRFAVLEPVSLWSCRAVDTEFDDQQFVAGHLFLEARRRFDGRSAVVDFWRQWFARNPDAQFGAEDMIVSGNRAVVRSVYRKMRNGHRGTYVVWTYLHCATEKWPRSSSM